MGSGGLLPNALGGLPQDISEALESEFLELERRFGMRDWGPAELNGGRFAEAMVRFLDWKRTGTYTPKGQQVNRQAVLSACRQDPAMPDSYRSHLTTCTELLMDVRNRRDVAHLGAAIGVNEMDTYLVMRVAAWSIAEIVRVEAALPPAGAQSLIDSLAEKVIPLVEEIGGDLIVLASDLPASARALVALYAKSPTPIDVKSLQRAVGYQNSTRFRRLIEVEAAERRVHLKGDQVLLTQKGMRWVEENVELDVAP